MARELGRRYDEAGRRIDISLSQRVKKRRKARLYKLERELREGRIPIPRFVPNIKLLELYRRYGADYATEIPLPHLNKTQWDELKKKERKILSKLREQVRNQYPSDFDSIKFRRIWKVIRAKFYRDMLERYAELAEDGNEKKRVVDKDRMR